MQAGQLRHRISVQAKAGGKDDFGNVRTDWTEVLSARAKKEELSGRELFAAQAVSSEITTRFRIRHRDGIKASMRIVTADGTAYNIISSIDRDGRRRELQILCSSGLSNG